MQYKPRKTYNGGKSFFGAIRSLPEKKLTLQPIDWIHNANKSGSPFVEIELDQYKHNPEISRLSKQVKRIKPTNNRYEKWVYQNLVKIVKRNWSDGWNIVAHSAGYDSRLLSTIIKELGYTNVIFFECGGEQIEFKKIMKLQGFSPNQYVVYKENTKPTKYWESCFTFDPERFNGLTGYPVNFHYDPYKDYVEYGILPADARIFSGYGGYIDKIFKRLGFNKFFIKNYNIQMSTFNFYGDWYMPFFDFAHVLEIAKYRRLHATQQRTTDALCRVYCKHLSSVPNPTIEGDLLRRGYRTWNGRKIKYSRYWGEWQLNEIIKYLKNHDYEIIQKKEREIQSR